MYKREFAQLVHTLSYGDAISSEVLAIDRAIKELGCGSAIYAINIHPQRKKMALDYRQLPADFQGTVILHYSLGSPLNRVYFELSRARRLLIHHNITPPHWFDGINNRVKRDIEQGLREFPEICSTSDLIIADSEYNCREVEKLNFKGVLLEIPFDPERWCEPANKGLARIVKKSAKYNLLSIGRLAPNKKLEDVIKLFYFFHYHLERDSRLWLVGIDTDTEIYSFELKRLVNELHLGEAVTFTGSLADCELRAMYENCDAYLCMSEHEGYCMPLMEAMYFGLPTIAFAATAVPQTVANGGVLFSEKHLAELAELTADIVRPGRLRDQIIVAGKARAAELNYPRFKESLAKLLEISPSD
ncbi:MAG TPA: glycosyltransferase [Oligoflexia bacterium]|nr:glycosyltransferase [Oligoflexia bacterium]HMP26426.1 glycosyltransferase [Oligoflexia bacterium]